MVKPNVLRTRARDRDRSPQPTCQRFTGTMAEVAAYNDCMSRTHVLALCAEHRLYHVWVPDQEKAQEDYGKSESARVAGYRRVPGGYQLTDHVR